MKSIRLPVVYDCMVFLQGLTTENGIAARCLELIENEEIELFLSREILWEIEDVLTRRNLKAKFPLLTQKRVEKLLELLNKKATFVKNVPRLFSYPRDTKDEKYINLAVSIKADYIVSRDNDLLDLMSGFTDEGKEFRHRFRFLRIVEPIAFLSKIESLKTAD